MSIYVTTGNRLDVVYDYREGRQTLLGLRCWGSNEIIPLPEPEGLISCLQRIVKECRDEEQFGSAQRTPNPPSSDTVGSNPTVPAKNKKKRKAKLVGEKSRRSK